MGYRKKRSKDSLIASSIITGLLLTSAYLMGKPDTTYGVRLALGMCPIPSQYIAISHMLYRLPAFVYTAVALTAALSSSDSGHLYRNHKGSMQAGK